MSATDVVVAPTDNLSTEPLDTKEDATSVVEEVTKAEETPAVTPEVKVEAPAASDISAVADTTTETPTSAPQATTEETKQAPEAEVPSKEERPKSPRFISKILAPWKKVKVPKSPKKDKKKEESEAPASNDTATKEETAVATSEQEPEGIKASDPVKDAAPVEPVISETVVEEKEEPKEDKPKPTKVNRRISTRIGDLFTSDLFKSKPKPEIVPPAKVDEHPPKIDEPSPVPPLENPTPERPNETSASEAAPAVEVPSNPTPVVTATPVVAAAA